MSTTAVFHVIQAASARTVSIVSSGWNRRPPFVGPRESLYWTRKPWKTLVLPSSILTGSVTWSSRRGQRRSSWIAASSFKSLAASSSCRCAIRNGLLSSDIEVSSNRPRIIRRGERPGQAKRLGHPHRGEAVLRQDRHRARPPEGRDERVERCGDGGSYGDRPEVPPRSSLDPHQLPVDVVAAELAALPRDLDPSRAPVDRPGVVHGREDPPRLEAEDRREAVLGFAGDRAGRHRVGRG